MKQLSIIVPVYQVEQYIRTCLESIFRQGLNDDVFEVIIVNDGTPDRSMEVIADIISQHHNITVINQENQGLSVARNNGIAAAKGEYIIMPDSDDLLIDNSLPFLIETAFSSKADLVVADFLKMSSEDISNHQITAIKQEDTKIIEKTGKELLLEDLNPYQCYIWRTLFRREFIIHNELSFVSGIVYQDIPFIHEAYIKANKCIKTNWLLNIYRVNRLGAATESFNKKKAMDYCVVIEKTWELRSLVHQQVLKKLQDDIFASFTSLVYFTSHEIKDPTERRQIIDHLKQLVPDLTFSNGTKQMVISLLYHVMPHTLIRLRQLYGRFLEDTIVPFIRHNILLVYLKRK